MPADHPNLPPPPAPGEHVGEIITIEYVTEDGDRVLSRLEPLAAAHLLEALFHTMKAYTYSDKEGVDDGGE